MPAKASRRAPAPDQRDHNRRAPYAASTARLIPRMMLNRAGTRMPRIGGNTRYSVGYNRPFMPRVMSYESTRPAAKAARTGPSGGASAIADNARGVTPGNSARSG